MIRSLILLAAWVAHAVAQSQAIGDISKTTPFGIPPDAFEAETANPVAQSLVSIPGYNLTAPSGFGPSGNGSSVDGWQLGVAVAADVSLAGAGGSDASTGKDTTPVTEATTLWLEAPGNNTHINTDVWRMCVAVFPFTNSTATDQNIAASAAASNGTVGSNSDCAPYLTSQCAGELAIAALSQGIDSDGNCHNITIPGNCVPYFTDGKGSSISSAIDQDTLSQGRFYAWGSERTARGNDTAVVAAEDHVWPVILTWAQMSGSAGVASANSYISCIRASGGNNTGGSGGSGVSGSGSGSGSGTATETGATPSSTESSSNGVLLSSMCRGWVFAVVALVAAVMWHT